MITIERAFSISLALNAIMASVLCIIIMRKLDKRKREKETSNKITDKES